jgi:hypothetical protein
MTSDDLRKAKVSAFRCFSLLNQTAGRLRGKKYTQEKIAVAKETFDAGLVDMKATPITVRKLIVSARNRLPLVSFRNTYYPSAWDAIERLSIKVDSAVREGNGSSLQVLRRGNMTLILSELEREFILAEESLLTNVDKGGLQTRTRRGHGRKKANYGTVQKEAGIATKWAKARDTGIYKGDFARDNGIKKADLDRLLDRVAKRKKHSE